MFTNLYANLSTELHLVNMVRPLLEALNGECDHETCYLGFLHQFYVDNLYTVLSDKLLSLGKIHKKSYHLHAMAQGKVLLAHLPEKDYAKWKSETKKLNEITALTIQRFDRWKKNWPGFARKDMPKTFRNRRKGYMSPHVLYLISRGKPLE